jgi:hypothetical protein
VNLTRIVLVFWGGLFVILGPLRAPGDGDLYWQRWLGELILRTHHLPNALGPETFTSAGATWVPQEWLFSVGVAAAQDHHLYTFFAIAVCLLPLGILVSIAARARGSTASQAIGIALIFAGVALTESFGIRAQVVGWLCFAWLLYFVERHDRWRYVAIPLTAAWANLHASVMLAPMVVAARAIGYALDGRWRDAASEVPLLAGVALAMLCTPLGIRLPQYALALSGSPIRHFIVEWQPGGLGDGSLLYGALPLALAIVLGGRATLLERKPQALVAALLFGAMIFATRNIPIFAIAAAPLAAAGIGARFRAVKTFLVERRDLEQVALPAIVVALIVCGVAVIRLQAVAQPRLPVSLIAQLERDPTAHRLFCEDFSWCSIALQYPNLHVYMDGRCDPYPLPVWKRYSQIIAGRQAGRTILSNYDVDAVVALRNGALARDLRVPPWRMVAGDRAFVLFRRE